MEWRAILEGASRSQVAAGLHNLCTSNGTRARRFLNICVQAIYVVSHD